jgi:hypothetical protein
MLEIKCPKCQALVGGGLGDYIRWRSDRRTCPNCGAELEISNGLICFGLCGLVFGALFASSNYWPFARAISLVLVVVLCWAIIPIIVRALGRWRVSTSGTAVSMKARKWSGVAHISGWVFAVAVLATFVIFGLQYKDLLAQAVDMDSDLYSTEGFLASVRLATVVGLGIAAVALAVNLFALAMRKRARLAEKQQLQD